MPATTPEDNKRYCKTYYQKARRDPVKYAAWLARSRDYYRRKKADAKPVIIDGWDRSGYTLEDLAMLAEERAAIQEG